MTIKQSEALRAYMSVKDLNQQKLSSGKTAKCIYELTSKLKPAFDFQVQEERKLYEAHPNYDPRVNGIRLEGKTVEERKKIQEEILQIDNDLKELSSLDYDIDFEPFDLDLEQNNIKISGEDIGNLSQFINFI